MAVGTPTFPTTLDDINTLGGVADNFLTTLSSGINAVVTTIPVASTTGSASAGWLVIDSEIVTYTGKTSNTFTGVVRGVSGTTAAIHSSGANVEDLAIAAHREVLRAAIELIETKLGTGSAIAVAKLAALTASRAVATDGSGFLTATSVTAAELAFLSGVTSALQTQLNAKQASGNYVTALTGDVTASGPGSVAATIANNAVTYAKLQNLTTARLLGRATAGTGNAEEITLGTGLSFSGTTLNAAASTTGVYNVEDYGLVGDGTTDDTAALQSLINTVAAAGGGTIFFPSDGPYIIGGALQDGSRRNAQILLPEVAIDDPQFTITFRGYLKPACSPSGVYEIDLPKGTIIKSTLASGSGTQPSVFGGRGPVSGAYNETSYCHIEFVDLIFQTVTDPSYSCLNLNSYTSVGLEDVIIAAGAKMSTPQIVEPTTTTSYGLRLPRESSGILQQIRGQLNVFGFYYGILMGELTHAQNIGVWNCMRGLEFPFSQHASLIQRLLVFWCPIGAAWSAEHAVDIRQWDTERGPGGEWYSPDVELHDAGDLARGNVVWMTVAYSVGRVHTFDVTGASYIFRRELGTNTSEGANPPAGSVDLSDTFTDSDGVALNVHTMDSGPGWTRIEGSGGNHITIQSNKASSYVDAGSAYAYISDAGAADADATADFVFGAVGSGNYCELIFRVSDASNYWTLRVHGSTVELIKKVGGSDSVVDTDTGSFTAGVPATFAVTTNGDTITATAGGASVGASDSFNNTETQWGIRMYTGSGTPNTCDNFEVTA